ncbi:MAG: DUF4945 domain-containing protein [Tannerella sp.]|nr:DUF4945 domain-containing protein [Tannerella sp.]
MKTIMKMLNITLIVMLFTSCYDRDIIDQKEFDHSLPKVENLNYTREGDVIKLAWQMPANISADFKRPLEVSVQVVENNIYRQIVTVENENTAVNITIDAGKKYRFVVKLLGYLTVEAQEEGKTDRVYSESQVIEVQ